ncbi:amidohydrolase family protein [Ramlibacter sp. AN1015]|uniref:amidohydrolase family protein n=1 Tax=Ramlibacter sp. AN1015 TaxID=3133428 RepID=UPI0030BF59F7
MSSDYFPFHPEPRRPARMPPAGTIDSQFHILGPRDKYPVRPGAAYEMPTATPDALKRMHEALGIRRGIIVQTTTYGEDHRVVVDALAALGPGYKACANALLFEAADDAELERLHAAGVRGARFSFRQALGAVLSKPAFDRAVGKIRELGWYMKVQPEQTGIVDSASWFEHLDIPILIDHMGRPDAALGPDRDPNIRKLRSLLERGNFWVMLSLGEKISQAGAPYDDVVPLARALIDAAPQRCVWGSDWPHPVSKKAPPNDADLLELLYRYVRSDAELQRILVDNPSALFGYGDEA